MELTKKEFASEIVSCRRGISLECVFREIKAKAIMPTGMHRSRYVYELTSSCIESFGVLWGIVFINTPACECLSRINQRGLSVPYHNYGIPFKEVVSSVKKFACKRTAQKLANSYLRDKWPKYCRN